MTTKMSDEKHKLHSFGLLGTGSDFDDTWSQLESSLLSILQNVGSGFPNDLWIELVEKVYKLCIGQGESSHIYSKLQELLLEYNQGKLQELQEFQRNPNHNSLDFLSQYQNTFVSYGTGMTYGAYLFSHLDRPWITSNHCNTGRLPKEGVYFVHELGLIIWKEVVFDALEHDLCSSTLAIINAAREHNLMDLGDGGVLQSVVETYEILGFEKRERSLLFQKHLEEHLIGDTWLYFIQRARNLIESKPIGQYMREAEKLLSEESARNSSFVGPYTTECMLLKAKEGLIFDHADRLVKEAATTMLIPPHEKRDDLKRLYTLITYVCHADGDSFVFEGTLFGGEPENQALEKLLQAFMNHIKCIGMEIVQSVLAQGGMRALQGSGDDMRRHSRAPGAKKRGANSGDVANMIINTYEYYSRLVKECFGDSPEFYSALGDACRIFINALPRAAEWLTHYAHRLLDKEFKESRIGEDARYQALDQVGFLFRYISDKDVFHASYANLLRKRITQLTSQSDESEERMLDNLRKASGFEYTSKLQRMFVDKTLSRELHTGYIRSQQRLALMNQQYDSPPLMSGKTMAHHGEEQHPPLPQIMHAAGLQGSAFSFTENELKASLTGDGHVRPPPGRNFDGTASPVISPKHLSPRRGLSQRMNILPSFAWGKTLFRNMRKNNEGGVPLENKSSLHLSETYIGGETAGGEGMMDYYPPQSAYGCTSAVGNTMPMIEAFTFVLTAGCWSLQSVKSAFAPPKPIEDYIKSFLQYYSESHSGRRLEWLFHLGHGEIYTHGFDKTYCIHSSTFQMGILYQFGYAKRLTVREIAQGVTIAEEELSRHLFPIIKAGLLLIESASPMVSCNDILPEHIVVVNEKFTSRRNRVKVSIVDHSKQPVKEEHSVEEDVAPDRMRSVQAAICRIMKSRKQMVHQLLCKEVQCQLKHLFVPSNAFIKQNVEELISKDYIERINTEEYQYCS